MTEEVDPWQYEKDLAAKYYLEKAAPAMLAELETIERSITGGGRIVTFSDADITNLQNVIAIAKGKKYA